MHEDQYAIVVNCWAALRLPGRIDVSVAAKVLGVAEHDIPILISEGLLAPLGKPAPNAPKWFAAIQIVRLATDAEWMNRATQRLSAHWRKKRARLQTGSPIGPRARDPALAH
jgi:hypothetical protein